MKLNRKGFTLIEVISVVVILGIIVVITFPIVTGVFESSEERSEEIFVKEVKRIIDGYVSLEGIGLQYVLFDDVVRKCDNIEDHNTCYNVKVYKNSRTINFRDIIDSNLMGENDLINPNKKISCSVNNVIEIYRDSDYVYCYKAKLDCVGAAADFDIDTCQEANIWSY